MIELRKYACMSRARAMYIVSACVRARIYTTCVRAGGGRVYEIKNPAQYRSPRRGGVYSRGGIYIYH